MRISQGRLIVVTVLRRSGRNYKLLHQAVASQILLNSDTDNQRIKGDVLFFLF